MPRPSIYDQHDDAFARVSAYVVSESGKRVATIAFKFPKDGAGRLWAYVHWLGTEMVRGYVGGYGYDKQSADVESAVARLYDKQSAAVESAVARLAAFPTEESPARLEAFQAALSNCGGYGWGQRLRDAGFDVWQAV